MQAEFPSPLGDYVFNRHLIEVKGIYPYGFRPLSGIMFSIYKVSRVSTTRPFCFRPLSGIMFSISSCVSFRRSKGVFPSPLGDYVFNLSFSWLTRLLTFRFRPLSGIMFSIHSKGVALLQGEWVSVPSRGLCFQSYDVEGFNLKEQYSFRPLSGIMFSIGLAF